MKKKDHKPSIKKPLKESKNLFPVVGIGASAGGLNAFKQLLKAIPEDSGIAFVLVQHLDPSHESLLPELLQKVTKIPVVEIKDEIKVAPNHIYIIPSNTTLLSNDGELELLPRKSDKNKRHLPIDLFFTSLAEVHESHSIGVVLSGTASDGTLGLKAIKDHGGMTFAQDEASAEYDGMPKSAVEAGVVDFILPPDKIPGKLLEITKITNGNGSVKKDEPIKKDEGVFKQMLSLLRIQKGTDFTYYKQTTIQRRILRRMAMNKNDEPSDYLNYLRKNKQEQDILYQDLLIPVTEFFRNPKIFEHLGETVFPKILETKKKNAPIRIWSAGCSTGQEAYSMAMCMKDYLGDKDRKIQLFATDISEPAVEKARQGIYKKTEMGGLDARHIKQYFTKVNGGFQVNKEIREICVFALHNLLKDPPFGKMDLISCRNVLIYMEPYLQKKALTTFHYAMERKGFLLLGKSETASPVPDLFASSSKKNKLFSPKDAPAKYMHVASEHSEQNYQDFTIKPKDRNLRTDFQKTADDLILDKYTPSGVVVNENLDIVHFRGSTADYLEQKAGRPSHNLLTMAKPDLAFELRSLLHKVKKDHEPTSKGNIPLEESPSAGRTDGVQRLISIEVIPLPNLAEPHYLILFHPSRPEQEKSIENNKKEDFSRKSKTDKKDLRINQLEKELAQLRGDMSSIAEEQEAVNEELQSANEELQSGNEELQSLNEELETSKEELQSTNEELTVVNQELLNLNEQLTEARNYTEAIIATVREPLLVLDKNLRVKSANKAFYATFHANKKETEGKFIYTLGNNQWNIPKLRELLELVLPEKEDFENYRIKHDFEPIGERSMLFNARQIMNGNKDDKLILLAMEDITDREKEEQRKSLLSAIVDSSDDAIVSKTIEGIITSWNKGAEKIFGYGPKEAIGKSITIIIPPELRQEEEMILDKIKRGQKVTHFETVRLAKDGTKIDVSLSISPIKDGEGKIIGASKVARDIGEQKKMVKELERSEHRYQEMIYSSPSLIAIFKSKEMMIEIANDAILESWGKGKDIIGKPLFEVMPEIIDQGHKTLLLNVYKTGIPEYAYERPMALVRYGKVQTMHYTFVYQPQRNIEGEIEGVAIIANEVTKQAETNKKLKESEEKFRRMTNLLPDMITNADAQGNIYYYNNSWEDFSGRPIKELEENGSTKVVHPEETMEFDKRWKHSMETGTDFEMEIRCLDKNGKYKWHLSRAVPVKDEEENIVMWIGTNTEIQHLKEEEKRKEDFLKMVSHELKTPITSIKGYVQLLLRMLQEGKEVPLAKVPIKPSLERIDVQISRLTRLISEMLDLSRLEDNKFDFENNTFSINEMVENTIQDIEYSKPEYKISIKHEFECNITADQDRIAQVLINFVTNAIKYSPDNQEVEVKVHKGENSTVVISVKDQGIGIDKKDKKKIFKRFYRVDGENQETYTGFGIGLFLSKEIIDRHNGTINVESKKGKGSVFSFSLPCGK